MRYSIDKNRRGDDEWRVRDVGWRVVRVRTSMSKSKGKDKSGCDWE